MKIIYVFLILPGILVASPFYSQNQSVMKLLQGYESQGITAVNAEQGKLLWNKSFKRSDQAIGRSCASCHTTDLTSPGKHVTTNKVIKPMSPESNPERLTDVRKIEKWFKRNCKWTLGRECTAQEKANVLAYIETSN